MGHGAVFDCMSYILLRRSHTIQYVSAMTQGLNGMYEIPTSIKSAIHIDDPHNHPYNLLNKYSADSNADSIQV